MSIYDNVHQQTDFFIRTLPDNPDFFLNNILDDEGIYNLTSASDLAQAILKHPHVSFETLKRFYKIQFKFFRSTSMVLAHQNFHGTEINKIIRSGIRNTANHASLIYAIDNPHVSDWIAAAKEVILSLKGSYLSINLIDNILFNFHLKNKEWLDFYNWVHNNKLRVNKEARLACHPFIPANLAEIYIRYEIADRSLYASARANILFSSRTISKEFFNEMKAKSFKDDEELNEGLKTLSEVSTCTLPFLSHPELTLDQAVIIIETCKDKINRFERQRAISLLESRFGKEIAENLNFIF